MRIPRFFKVVGKTFFDVPSWIGIKHLAASTNTIKDIGKDIFKSKAPARAETFEQAMVRLGLTEADLQNRIQEFSRLVVIFLALGAMTFLYTLYTLKNGLHPGLLIGLILTVFAMAQAFRFHFWIFQIKQRRLGCTFREWLNGSLRGMKK